MFRLRHTATWVTIVLTSCLARSELFAQARIRVSTVVASGFQMPVQVTHSGDGTGRLFVVEQHGVVRIIHAGLVLPTPFLDIESIVGSGGERGLLGVAFHPDYDNTGFFFVNYTDLAGDTVVARYSVSADTNVADPTSAFALLSIAQPFANHNGGQIQFGPLDGYLYIGMGDGGSGNDPSNHGQNTNTLLGSLLRLDVDGGAPYAVPSDNPFAASAGADEIWAYGLRNPFRFSFDRASGDLYIGDVGQNTWEEIDFQAAGTPGGLNFGWKVREGPCPRGTPLPCAAAAAGFTDPIAFYGRSLGRSVTGGFVYRGSRFPGLTGAYFFADFISGRLWSTIKTGASSFSPIQLELETGLNISSFGEDEQGELYVVDYSGGTVRLLEDVSPPPPILSIGPAAIIEGDTGTAEAQFQLMLSAPSASVITVPFSTRDGTATEGEDYLPASGTLTFPAGVGNATIGVAVLGDHVFEGDETFFLDLGPPSGAILMAPPEGIGTILNDDTPGLTISDVAVAEPASGNTLATFTVELSPAAADSVTVDYTTMDGLATVAERDYETASGLLTFGPGVTTQTIDVSVLADTEVEAPENYTVELSMASGAAIARGQATGTIFDRGFYTLDLCRLIDTRLPVSQLGGPALEAGKARVFLVAGTCGIPSSAKAISVNIAVTGATLKGNVRLYPGGTPVPPVSSINYVVGQTRSNNAVVALDALGRIAAFVGFGTVQIIIDVNGYFQ